jgi:hypothetical protein
VALAAYFALCSSVGWVWGTLAKTPDYPAIGGVPLYPGAQAIIDLTSRGPGLASPTPVTPGNVTFPLTNFQFTAEGSADAVLQFYRETLQEEYGFKIWRVESTGAGVTALDFVRDTRLKDKELIRIAVAADSVERTEVQATLDVQPAR